MNDSGVPRTQPHSALGKALSILEILLAQGEPVTLADVARRLNLPRQTVHRLLGQLEVNGMVRREPVRSYYAVGPRFLELGLQALRSAWQSGPVHKILTDLVTRTGESCNLGVLEGASVLYIDRVESNWPLRVDLHPGSRVPFHATAIGKLLVAHLPSRNRRRLLHAGPLTAYTTHTLTDASTLETHMKTIRRTGYAMNQEEYVEGAVGVAVPIRGARNQVVAGLSLHAPQIRMPLDVAKGHLPQVIEAARRIEQQIAWMTNVELSN